MILRTAGLVMLVGAMFGFGRRRDADASDRLARAVDDMRTRMDDLVADLSRALERAERESRRNRMLGELGSSIDLEELVERVIDSALELGDFDAAMLVLDESGDAPTIGVRGMSVEEAARPPTSGATPSRTMTVSYRYPAGETAGQPEAAPSPPSRPIQGGLFVPLAGRDGQQLGMVALFWRRHDWEPSRDEVEAVEGLAESCIPAIGNARRFREARQLAETDALTDLYNQRYFHETLRREALRAQRYSRQLALIVFDLDDFKAVNDQVGHLAGDSVLAQVAEGLREAVRSVDIACRIGGDEFAVILPESSVGDADLLYRRVQERFRSGTFGPGGQRLRLSAGIAELHHGDTAAALFERADAALLRAKGLGKDRADIARDYDEPGP